LPKLTRNTDRLVKMTAMDKNITLTPIDRK